MGQGVWIDSDKLGPDDEVRRGAQSTAPCPSASSAWPRRLKALIGKHHGESEEAQNLGLEIIGAYAPARCDDASAEARA